MSPTDCPTDAPVTIPALREMKARSEPIAMLTAYDATFAATMDAAGVDVVLVGDSLGMVVQGQRNTLAVDVDAMVYHTAAVARGLRRALLLADLPFASYMTAEQAGASAARLIGAAGASMVKLEGAGRVVDIIAWLVARDMPVCAHLGLTPQSVLRLGGYKVQGREERAAERLRADACAVADAGADLLVLECVPAALAAEITRAVPIPTIGIGAGAACDGQVLVCYDMLGIGLHSRPRFVRDFLAGTGSIAGAFKAYVGAVKDRSFPAETEWF